MTFDLPGGRRLVLAGGAFGWAWLASGAVAALLIWVLYREERKLVSRRAGLTLLGLRGLAALALVAMLFEPIASRTFREVVRGRVLLAVDVSESMDTADPGRDPDAKARLGALLGMSPAEPVDALTRREVARRLVAGPLGRLAEGHAVEFLAFARGARPATPASLDKALAASASPDDPDARETDWEPSLAEAVKAEGSGAPVVGVVLVTDGRRNAPGDASATVDRLAARGVPVFPLLVGATDPPRDAAVASVEAPATVYKGDAASVAVTLKLDGDGGRDVAVTLERPGAEPLKQTVKAPTDGSRPVVTFRVPMEQAGTVPLTVAVEPREGDARRDNDRRTVAVQVADDKARVLLVDGEARWEFRYLRNALLRDPRVAVNAVVLRQPRDGASASSYAAGLPQRGAGDGPDPLGNYDVIVVGDVAPVDLPAADWSRLDAFVAERGGALVFSAGPRSWAALASSEPSRALLPVSDPRPIRVDPRDEDPAHPELPPGVPLTPAPAASADPSAWPMLQLAADPAESLRRWGSLPRLPWAVAGRPKPGATPLASAGPATRAGDPAAAVLASQPYGLGKVFWVGTDGTWRWRHRVGDAYHHRFWGQVVRWAASGKLGAGNDLVRFGPLKPRAGEFEPSTIRARIAEGVPGVTPDLLVAARLFRAGPDGRPAAGAEAAAVVPLRPRPGEPRAFEGTAPGLPRGSYVIRLDAPDLADALLLNPPPPSTGPEAALEVTARETSERVELAAARDPLERLAAATGGKVVTDDRADALPPLLRARTKPTVRTEESPLWDSPPALLLFLAVVTAEWVARKRLGLP